MSRSGYILFILFAGSLITFSCQSEYEKMVRTELASGVRNDSIFFGLSLGMTSKDFFARCWELNKEGVFYHGAQNTTVEYRYTFKDKAYTMNFYQTFMKRRSARCLLLLLTKPLLPGILRIAPIPFYRKPWYTLNPGLERDL